MPGSQGEACVFRSGLGIRGYRENGESNGTKMENEVESGMIQ